MFDKPKLNLQPPGENSLQRLLKSAGGMILHDKEIHFNDLMRKYPNEGMDGAVAQWLVDQGCSMYGLIDAAIVMDTLKVRFVELPDGQSLISDSVLEKNHEETMQMAHVLRRAMNAINALTGVAPIEMKEALKPFNSHLDAWEKEQEINARAEQHTTLH